MRIYEEDAEKLRAFNFKAVASRLLRSGNPTLKDISRNGLLWSRSYFACSMGGATIDIVRAILRNRDLVSGLYPSSASEDLPRYYAKAILCIDKEMDAFRDSWMVIIGLRAISTGLRALISADMVMLIRGLRNALRGKE